MRVVDPAFLPRRRVFLLLCCAGLTLRLAYAGYVYARGAFHRFIPGSTLGGFNFYTTMIVPEDKRGTSQEIFYELAGLLLLRERMANGGPCEPS